MTVSSQQANFDPLRVGGAFAGIETLTLHLLSGETDVEATKVKYTFTLQENPQQLPQDLTDAVLYRVLWFSSQNSLNGSVV